MGKPNVHVKTVSRGKSSSNNKKVESSKVPEATVVVNRPRNFWITEATGPVEFDFPGRFRIHHSIRVQQTANDETWPGGAVWDAGWCLTQLIVAVAAAVAGPVTTITTTNLPESKRSATTQLPNRVMEVIANNPIFDCNVILELGCGVGLTGLVAAAALHAKTTILTDLDVVIRKVTQPNVILNTVAESRKSSKRIINKGKGQVLAMPLCWGNADDEKNLRVLLDGLRKPPERIPNKQNHLPKEIIKPNLILIGDVAYQHTPGAPSHFEALVSTLRKFVDHQTMVIFATRLRMPASADLLDLLLEHFYEIVQPAVSAEEIERNIFGNVKHNLNLHFLKLKDVKQS